MAFCAWLDAKLRARGTLVEGQHVRLPTEQEEIRRLQRENARLQQELEFLKKAAAYFAKGSR